MENENLRFKCDMCGKLTAGRIPRRGDGSGRYPRKHKVNGEVCLGSFDGAVWVLAQKVKGQFVEIEKTKRDRRLYGNS
jgi:hypothetical protein